MINQLNQEHNEFPEVKDLKLPQIVQIITPEVNKVMEFLKIPEDCRKMQSVIKDAALNLHLANKNISGKEIFNLLTSDTLSLEFRRIYIELLRMHEGTQRIANSAKILNQILDKKGAKNIGFKSLLNFD